MKNKFLLLLIFIFSVPASAEVKVRDWDRINTSKNFKWYVAGVGSGLFWANIDSSERGLGGIYCPPRQLALSVDTYMEILKKELNSYGARYNLDTPLPLVLMSGLKRTFPCNE